jgi:hypothetical protein
MGRNFGASYFKYNFLSPISPISNFPSIISDLLHSFPLLFLCCSRA